MVCRDGQPLRPALDNEGQHPFLVLNLSCLLKIDPTRHIAEGLWNQVEPVSMGAATLIQVTLAFLQKIHLKHLRPSQITYGTWSFWRLSHWKKCQLQDMSDMTARYLRISDIFSVFGACLDRHKLVVRISTLNRIVYWDVWKNILLWIYRTYRTYYPIFLGDEPPFPQLLFQFLLNKRINHAEMTQSFPFPEEFSVPIDRNPPPKKIAKSVKLQNSHNQIIMFFPFGGSYLVHNITTSPFPNTTAEAFWWVPVASPEIGNRPSTFSQPLREHFGL